jgi:hypothetical protein
VRRGGGAIAALLAIGIAFAARAWANDGFVDPAEACDRAAARAEREFNLPAGLLAAVGVVESGRLSGGATMRRAWPWSINAEGWSTFAPSRSDAIKLVRAFQARGARYIDVGCFQVDLFYHPRAFATLAEAFDPEANAQAASRILLLARFGSAGWEQAIARYHSASIMRGAWYLQRVMAIWPTARTRLATLDLRDALPAYVALLSPEARLVRIVASTDEPSLHLLALPRVIVPGDVPGSTDLGVPMETLPRVLGLEAESFVTRR